MVRSKNSASPALSQDAPDESGVNVGQREVPLVQPRGLIPSERQSYPSGGPLPSYDFAAGAGDRPRRKRPRPVAGMRRFAAEANPLNIGGPKIPLLVLGLSALFAQWDDAALTILLPEMRAEFGFSLQFLLTLASVLGIVSILLAPAMGFVADRVRRVWMLRIGALLANVSSIVQGVSTGVSQLVLGRTMAGVGGAIREPASFPLLADYYPSTSRTRVFAFLGFMAGVGGLVGPSVAGSLGERLGWRFAVISLGALATLVTLGFFLLREPPRGYLDRLEMGVDEDVAEQEQRPVSWGEAWRAASSITTVRRLWYATPFLQVGWVGMAVFLSSYYAQEFGLGPQQRGYIQTVQGAAALVGVVVAAPIADRLLAHRPGRVMVALGWLMVLYVASIVVLAVSRNVWLSVIVGLPISFGFVAIGPALFTLMSLVVPARARGLGMQTIAPWQLIGMALLPFIGRAADTWGIRQGLLAFAPLSLIGGLILASSSRGVERDIRAARAASLAGLQAQRPRSDGQTKILVCRDLDVHYGGVQALFGVDFDVEQGEMVALLGSNGAGKSTLLKAIGGVEHASNGAVFFDGDDITHVPPDEIAGRGISIVPGNQAVFATLTVEENLTAAAWMFRREPELVKERVDEALSVFPILQQRLSAPAGVLSGGEQRMLTLAQAFIEQPKLLLIDELSVGLAPAVLDELLDILRELNVRGTTIILVEQSINVALELARRAVFMERGEVRFDGTTEDLLANPRLFRSVFMGPASASAGRLTTGKKQVGRSDAPILVTEGVSVSFGGVHAVNEASLEVATGEVVGLIGPNGAGKSTLFDVISGFVTPDSGLISFKGRQIGKFAPSARARLGIGRSFQQVRLFPSMTVRENLAVARTAHAEGVNPLLAAVWAPSSRKQQSQIAGRVDYLLELFGLEEVGDKFTGEISTGTRRALEIACLNAGEFELLLLDEPSSGLAQTETTDLALLLARIARETGRAMLIIDHDTSLLASVCERLIAMHLGRIIASGSAADVLEDLSVKAAYFPSSSPNAHSEIHSAHVTD